MTVSNNKVGTYVALAWLEQNSTAVFSFRGSTSREDWLADFQLWCATLCKAPTSGASFLQTLRQQGCCRACTPSCVDALSFLHRLRTSAGRGSRLNNAPLSPAFEALYPNARVHSGFLKQFQAVTDNAPNASTNIKCVSTSDSASVVHGSMLHSQLLPEHAWPPC